MDLPVANFAVKAKKASMSDVFSEIEIIFISSFLLIASYIQMHV